jgi:uncharacterized protein (TIGR02996 family)
MSPRPRRVVPSPFPIEPWFRRFPGVEGFLEAAAHEPWEDAHRLILADWLEDQGEQERGEFLRLQVQIAASGRWTRSRNIDRRAHELETKHQERWLAGMPPEATFDRGLVSGLRLEGDHHRIPDILGRATDVMDVQSFILDPVKIALIAWGWTLLFSEAVRLQVCSLRMADFPPGSRLHQVGLATLCGTHGLIHLRHLFLNDSHLSHESARLLAESQLTNLTHLHLGRNPLGELGARILGESPALASVTHLNLAGTSIGDGGALAILVSPNLRHLVQLSLRDCDVGHRAVAALAASDGLRRLTHLDLSDNHIPTQSAITLAKSRALPNLTYLNLAGNNVGSEGIEALRTSPNLPRLTTLRE